MDLALIADLYRKLGFSAARRTQDDLAEVFVRFLEKPRRLGSELGQLLAHASDGERVRERLAAEGVADVDAFLAGRWNSEQEQPGDLLLERFLVRDMDTTERATVTATLEQSTEARELLDRLLKQRLIFLADYPAESFAERVAELVATRAERPQTRRRPNLKWISVPAAAVAVVALLSIGLLTQARSPNAGTPVAEPDAAEPARHLAMVETRADPAPTPASMTEPEPEPEPAETTRERGAGAWLITYARAGSEVRPLDDGAEIDADERLVTWVKTRQAGYAAVVAVEEARTRIHFADAGRAAAIPAGGPTRLGKGRTLSTDAELVLLVSPEPFAVRPIVARMRRGADPNAVFDGTIRRTTVRLAETETETAAGSQ